MPDKVFNAQSAAELFRRRYDRPGDVLVETLARDEYIIAPGVYEAYGAMAASENYQKRIKGGFPCAYNAVYLGGWSISAMLWQRPDMGFHTLPMISLIGEYAIPAAFPLPVIMDAEAGFGNKVTLTETVEKYHALGVALAHLEDQDQDEVRRCGNMGGKACVPPQAMVEKITSWLAASYERGTSMRLMARTDAFTAAGGGLQDAIERMKRYMDCDYQGFRPLVSWADALIDKRDIETWATELLKHDPKMVLGINYSPNKDWTGYYQKQYGTEPPTYDELRAMGFKVIWHTILEARAAMEASWNIMEQMADSGAKALWDLHERQRDHPVSDTQGMSGARRWQAYEKFIGGQAAQDRYDKSQGYKAEESKDR